MSRKISSDSHWEKLGQTAPYFGVCSDEVYMTSNLTENALQSFFESGQKHVSHVLDTLSWLFKKPIKKINTVLDFGCGTGRLLIPFSTMAEKAVGIDVSHSMLKEAGNNLKKMGVENVELIRSNSLENIKTQQFDLVHTYIVLQHIPVHIGYEIIQSLLKAIKPGGFGMIHFTYRNDQGAIQNIGRIIKSKYPLVTKISNLIRNRVASAPHMQMNNYDLKKVFKILENEGIGNYYAEFTNHGGFHGVCLYLLKTQTKEN